jgi:hypothetical protein
MTSHQLEIITTIKIMMNHSIGSALEYERAENGPVCLCMNSSYGTSSIKMSIV